MRLPWNRRDTELEREIAHHLHQLAAGYQRQGHPPEESRLLARQAFGGAEQVKEMCRDENRWAWTTGLRQDILFGIRMIRKAPVVTLAAVLSLALGIGANSAIVSLMDVVLWRDLPVPEPRQLTLVNWQSHGFPKELATSASGSFSDVDGWEVADFFSHAAFQQIHASMAGRASIAAFAYPEPVSISYAGHPAVSYRRPVSGSFFSTLRVRPHSGRLLAGSDDASTATPTVVVSHAFWANTLASDPNALGGSLRLNNRPHVIIGILDASFHGLTPGDPVELYTPLWHSGWLVEERRGGRPLDDEGFWCLSLIARRNPGVTIEQIRPAMDMAFRSTWRATPKDRKTAPRIRLEEGSRGLGFLRSHFRSPLIVLGALVGLLLVIACTNIANLLLARASARQREIALRISLGCSRLRLMRQFLTESGLLALLGGSAAVAVAYLTANLLGTFLRGRESTAITVDLDFRMLAMVGLISFAALLLFGLFPAWRSAGAEAFGSLKKAGGSMGAVARGGWNTGRLLVLVQMALSIVLVTSAVIFTRNLVEVQSEDPGFDRRNLIMFGTRPGTSGYEQDRLLPFYFQLEQRMASIPGVASVGLASTRPMNVGGWWQRVGLTGQSDAWQAAINSVTPHYLSTYSPRMVAGRGITWSDITGKAKVAVISQDLAGKLGGHSALGRKLTFAEEPGAVQPTFEIVGIAPSMATNSTKERPFAVWLPLEPDRREVTVILRTSAPPAAVLPAIREAMLRIDRNLPMVDVVTIEEQISNILMRERMFATLCGGFGALALLLAVVGLYGVMSYSTSRRRAEIGVRLALGAVPGDVIRMVMREGLVVAVAGTLLGAPVVWFGASYLEKELFRMKPLEPATILLATGTLLAAAVIAVWIPASRAAGLQPMDALRQD